MVASLTYLSRFSYDAEMVRVWKLKLTINFGAKWQPSIGMKYYWIHLSWCIGLNVWEKEIEGFPMTLKNSKLFVPLPLWNSIIFIHLSHTEIIFIALTILPVKLQDLPPERAFADFVLCNLVLHLVIMNFLG